MPADIFHLEAGTLWLVYIEGLEVCTPVLDQIGVVVVVFCGHPGRLVLMWLVHVYNLHNQKATSAAAPVLSTAVAM